MSENELGVIDSFSIMDVPDFLILGAPKCGTTSLSNALASHPDIYIPPIKEVGFFADDTNWRKGVEWYASHFEDAAEGALIGEATPTYLRAPVASERIERVCPHVRLIAMVRDPVERARSHYWFRRRYGTEHRQLRTAFEDELERFPDWNEDDYLLPPGCYAEHLSRYVQVFSQSRILIVSLGRLSSCPHKVLSEVQRFLGVQIHQLSLNQDNRSVAPRSSLHRDAVQWLVKSQGIIKSLGKLITTRKTRQYLRAALHAVNMADQPKPPLPKDIEARLEQVFSSRKHRVEEMYDIKI